MFKDFADIKAPDPENPLGLFTARVDKVTGDLPLEYHWFNGKVRGEIHPMGSRGDGKIYPFKSIGFNQPVDGSGHPVPVKWGLIFLKGDVAAAAATGLALYESMYSEELAAKTGIPPVPGEFIGTYKTTHNLFSISHGITKAKALRCTECHAADSVLNFEALGYSKARAQRLMTLEVQDPDTNVVDWSLFN